MVQQQALRDFDQAMRNFYGGTDRRPSVRLAGHGLPRAGLSGTFLTEST